MIWISCRVLQVETSCSRNSIKAALVCRSAVLPCTLPVFTSSAAYKDRVPLRRYSNRGARVGPVIKEVPDPNDPALQWRFSRPRKTQPHAAVEPCTSRSGRQPCFQNPDRRSPCSVPSDGDGHRLASECAALCPC